MTQPVITYGPVVALNVGILLGFARLDVVDVYALFLCPRNELVADVFRTVVPSEGFKFPPSDSWSGIKSIDQPWFTASGTASGSGFSRIRRFFGLIRRLSSSDR